MALKKEIEFIVNETFGPDALPIALYLNGKENISEFVIAKDLDTEIHRVRQILYKLLEDNTVTFIRKKDKVKGWYICYWSLNEPEFPYVIRKIRQNKIDKLQARLKQETAEDFYMCKNICTRMDFDNAFEINFKCPDCGEIMNLQSGERTIKFLRTQIEKLKKEIGTKPIVPTVENKPVEEPKVKKPVKKKVAVKPKVVKKKTPVKKEVKKPVKKKVTKPKTTKKKTPVKKKVAAKPKKKKFSLFKRKKKK